jgi:flavin-dependent dehydrogenase
VNAFDVLVIGAGPSGATAGLVLARAGLKVAIVEKVAFPRRKVCGEFISATTWPLLRTLGVAADLLPAAGPPVRRVGLYAGETMASAPMPAPDEADAWGRAIGREHLDTALLDAAVRTGATLWQPWSVEACVEEGGVHRATLVDRHGATQELRARAVVAAHGSWERGALPTQAPRSAMRASDLLGFKAHFEDARLPAGLMPLLLFPGGYGGLVASDGGRTSFSCCVRRDTLRNCRNAHPGLGAGEALLMHVIESCRGVREGLSGARREQPWLSAGPIQPGIRALARGHAFVVGNAAGEAHPLVAEGISMAIQSAWLLGTQLASMPDLSDESLAVARGCYEKSWRRNFAPRLRASSIYARLTLSRATAPASVAVLRGIPASLTWGARWSGKAATLRPIEIPT